MMKLIEKSLHIALQAYAGKTDKAGREYILHPLRVMAKMNCIPWHSPPGQVCPDALEVRWQMEMFYQHV